MIRTFIKIKDAHSSLTFDNSEFDEVKKMTRKYRVLYWIGNNQYCEPVLVSREYFECINHICRGCKVFIVKRKFLKQR